MDALSAGLAQRGCGVAPQAVVAPSRRNIRDPSDPSDLISGRGCFRRHFLKGGLLNADPLASIRP